MRKSLVLTAVCLLVGACGYVSEYEKGVYDYEPVYCYQSIGGVECFKEPKHRDERRLVNYYGPAPSRYDKPEPAPEPQLFAPPPVDFFVRDPEPVPQPKPLRTAAPATAPGAAYAANAAFDTPVFAAPEVTVSADGLSPLSEPVVPAGPVPPTAAVDEPPFLYDSP